MRKPTQGVTCPESHSYCIWNYLTDSDLYFYSLGNPFYRTFYHLEHRFWYLGSCIVPLKPYLPTLTLLWDLLRPLPISQPSQFSSFCGLQSHFCFLFPTFSVHLGLPFCSHFITSLQITSIQPSLPSLSLLNTVEAIPITLPVGSISNEFLVVLPLQCSSWVDLSRCGFLSVPYPGCSKASIHSFIYTTPPASGASGSCLEFCWKQNLSGEISLNCPRLRLRIYLHLDSSFNINSTHLHTLYFSLQAVLGSAPSTPLLTASPASFCLLTCR